MTVLGPTFTLTTSAGRIRLNSNATKHRAQYAYERSLPKIEAQLRSFHRLLVRFSPWGLALPLLDLPIDKLFGMPLQQRFYQLALVFQRMNSPVQSSRGDSLENAVEYRPRR